MKKGQSTKSPVAWKQAEEHFYKMKNRYLEIEKIQPGSGMPALMITFLPLESRFRHGDLSDDLWAQMMRIE